MESRTLASRLRCPNGAEASEVARKMNEANCSLMGFVQQVLVVASVVHESTLA